MEDMKLQDGEEKSEKENGIKKKLARRKYGENGGLSIHEYESRYVDVSSLQHRLVHVCR